MGGRLSDHSKWNLDDFTAEGFEIRISRDKLLLDYDGLEHWLNAVPLEHTRWFASLAAQLTDEQLQAAFHAAGANQEEVDGFSAILSNKIMVLRQTIETAPS